MKSGHLRVFGDLMPFFKQGEMSPLEKTLRIARENPARTPGVLRRNADALSRNITGCRLNAQIWVILFFLLPELAPARNREVNGKLLSKIFRAAARPSRFHRWGVTREEQYRRVIDHIARKLRHLDTEDSECLLLVLRMVRHLALSEHEVYFESWWQPAVLVRLMLRGDAHRVRFS